MKKTGWLPHDEAGQDEWLTNLAAKFNIYAVPLGFVATDATALLADAVFFHYVYVSHGQILAYAQQWTAYKNAVAHGTAPSLGLAPVPPSLGTAPPAVAPNIIGRAQALVARIKVSPSYTTAIGEALRIEGAEHVVDFAGLKPVLTLAQVAGHVQVKWVKQEMDALELWVDRSGGNGFALLSMATISPCVDDAGLPGGMHSAMWQYKGIYIKSGARVGQWSDIVFVAVAG